ncbi:hypothetical protein G6F65_022102 [Rhizopus arrhizus]|nr:hypothetical protein G6F65_022102 [Rhizopus arrhizus]
MMSSTHAGLQRGRIAVALNFHARQGLRDPVQIGGGQFDGGSAQVLFQAMQLGCSGDRHDPGFLRQQPGKCDLRGGYALVPGNLAEQVHQSLVCTDRLRREARYFAAKIVAAESRAVLDGARQEALAQWTEGDETDAERFQGRQDFLFRLAPP